MTAALSLAAGSAFAGSAQYDVTSIPMAPGAFSTVATGMSDSGVVVGWAQYSQAPILRPWRWSASSGLEVLPLPAGFTLARAMDVNAAGVIAGDGGGDGGKAWRLVDGTFEIIEPLPGDTIGVAARLNAQGDVAGTSKTSSIVNPPDVYLAGLGDGPELAFANGQARAVNDARLVVGWTTANKAFRTNPGGATLVLTGLPGKPLSYAYGVNAAGDFVGEAKQASGNGEVPFLHTDAGGTIELGNFGGNAAAVDVNDARVVVGNHSTGVPSPWRWTERDGIVFLNALIPEGSTRLLSSVRINDSGMILMRATDTATGDLFPVVLTPKRGPFVGDLNGDGTVNGDDLAILLGSWGLCSSKLGRPCPGDLNGDGEVDGDDLAILLGAWS